MFKQAEEEEVKAKEEEEKKRQKEEEEKKRQEEKEKKEQEEKKKMLTEKATSDNVMIEGSERIVEDKGKAVASEHDPL
ncbi:hypothetical protein A2U01_0081774, partial [Trifolium medium]|nr:hypothetical protein [Trifolium medium]